MIKLEPKIVTFRYPADVQKIVSDYAKNQYEITPDQAEEIWLEFSDMMCAGWMRMDDESDAFHTTYGIMQRLFNEVEGSE